MTAAPIRVVIAEDHQLVRDGLVAVLAQASDLRVVATAATGADALARCRAERPDVLLLDLRLPVLDGLSVVEALRREGELPRILLLSSYEGSELVVRAVRAGARGFVPKSAPAADMLTAIRSVHLGRLVLPPELQERLVASQTAPELSAREIEVLRLVAEGRSNHEIARALEIASATAKNHVNNILGKLGAADRTHAVVIAIQRGLLDVG